MAALPFNFLLFPPQPVFLSFRIAAGAGKPIANMHKCCVVQWRGGKYHVRFLLSALSSPFPPFDGLVYLQWSLSPFSPTPLFVGLVCFSSPLSFFFKKNLFGFEKKAIAVRQFYNRKKMPPTWEDISGKFIIARRKRRRKLQTPTHRLNRDSSSHPSKSCVPCSSFIITVLVILGCLCSTSLFLAWTQVPTTPKNLLYLTVLYILVSSKVDFLFLYGNAYIMLQSGCQNLPTKKNPHISFFLQCFASWISLWGLCF